MFSSDRFLAWALICCFTHAPVVWGHSHEKMDAEQLVAHLCQYHPATSDEELPKGWHWHVSCIDDFQDTRSKEVCKVLISLSDAHRLLLPGPDTSIAVLSAMTMPSRFSVPIDLRSARAIGQQKTYLRLNVLLI